MDDYLTKPLHVSALAQALERWVAQSQTADAAQPAAEMTPAGAAPEAPLMDFARLEEFKEFDDEALSMTRDVIGLFLSDTPPRLEALAKAVTDQDAGALARAAHALKGGASNVGAKAIQQHADALEAAAQDGMPADAGRRVETVASSYRIGRFWRPRAVESLLEQRAHGLAQVHRQVLARGCCAAIIAAGAARELYEGFPIPGHVVHQDASEFVRQQIPVVRALE